MPSACHDAPADCSHGPGRCAADSGAEQLAHLVRPQRQHQGRQPRTAVLVDQQVVEQSEEVLLVRLDLVGRCVLEAEAPRDLGDAVDDGGDLVELASARAAGRGRSAATAPRPRSATASRSASGVSRTVVRSAAGTCSAVHCMALASRGSRSETESCGKPEDSTIRDDVVGRAGGHVGDRRQRPERDDHRGGRQRTGGRRRGRAVRRPASRRRACRGRLPCGRGRPTRRRGGPRPDRSRCRRPASGCGGRRASAASAPRGSAARRPRSARRPQTTTSSAPRRTRRTHRSPGPGRASRRSRRRSRCRPCRTSRASCGRGRPARSRPTRRPSASASRPSRPACRRCRWTGRWCPSLPQEEQV